MRLSGEGIQILLPERLYKYDPSAYVFDSGFKSLYREWFPKAKRLDRWVGLRIETPLVEQDGFVFYNRSQLDQFVFDVYATIGDDEVWVENPEYSWVKIDEIEL